MGYLLVGTRIEINEGSMNKNRIKNGKKFIQD